MWRLLAMLALGLAVAFPVGGTGASMESFIDTEMPASGVPGLAYAVVADGDVTSVGARGVARSGGERPITPDTPFLTGSISKSFTALAVMQLVEAGTLDLDADVARYLDGFSRQPAGAVTIRQLLSHTSGFSTWQGNASHTDGTTGSAELALSSDRLARVDPAHEPDQRWEYSNANYQILGRLIEVVSGQEYQSYLATKVLKPVGMEHSFVADGEIHESMATGHRPWFGSTRPLPDNATDRGTAPQGGIVASANDVARYLQVMMNGRDDVLSAEGKARMMRPASETSPGYGFGWFVDPSEGTVGHEGRGIGFETLATMVPTEKKAVVVLVNGGSGLGFGETTRLREGITVRAMALDDDGVTSRWPRKALFIGMVLLPTACLLGTIRTWFRRVRIRATLRRDVFGLLGVWFPVLAAICTAWIVLRLVPRLEGAPLGTMLLFQPDIGVLLIATAVSSLLWAAVRVGVAHSGTSRPPR